MTVISVSLGFGTRYVVIDASGNYQREFGEFATREDAMAALGDKFDPSLGNDAYKTSGR